MSDDIRTDDDGQVIVPDDVYSQLEALRESGAVNMFTDVKRGLREFGFDEALEWVNNNQGAYVEGFSNGIVPESEVDDDE